MTRTSYSIAPIPVVATYFADPDARPLIAEEYTPGKGWVRSAWRKRISRAWARKLRAAGVTSVALAYDGRVADFTVAELLATGF